MAEKRKAPEAPEGAHRRKRAAPTIDLAATEVKARGGPKPPVDEPGPTGPRDPKPVQEPPSDPSPPPVPEKEPPPAVDEPPPPEEEPTHIKAAAPPPARDKRQSIVPALAAGLVGAAIMAVVLLALWFGGALQAPTTDSADVSAQVAGLQKQVQDLQRRPPAPAIDSKAVDALTQRVARIEDTLAKLPKDGTDMAQRLAAAENAMKSLGVALAALNKRSDDVAANVAQAQAQAEAAENAVTQLRGSVQDVAKDASAAVAPAQLEALQQRLAALEQSTKAAREDIAKTSAADKAARLALSAAALRAAVVAGAPFSVELAQVKALGADDQALAPLAPFADKGLPSEAALAQELRALLPAMVKASGAPAPSGGFLERLQANASKLVRVQPVEAPPGDDAAAVLARLEVEAAHADIAAALADLAKLPEAARAPAQAWIAKAEARGAALAAAHRVAADSARALGSQ